MISIIIFSVVVLAGVGLFSFNAKKIVRNINLGKSIDRSDYSSQRWKTMILVAFGQSKMLTRPTAAIMHLFVYIGFVVINLEVLEIVIDGLTNHHRIFAPFLGGLYDVLIASFEVLAFLVLFGCLIFLLRRNIVKLKRFISKDLNGWPRSDANIILITEILLMSAFLTMNACDSILQTRGLEHYITAGSFPISSLLTGFFQSMSTESLVFIERSCWWFHIIGIFAFLNYLPYSKHFHILLAFPNTYFSNLLPKGKFTNMASVTQEVKLMLDPSAPVPEVDPNAGPLKFGVSEVTDLTWKNLLDAYTCTECGRCSSVCPANQTGKELSPRKIMMSTRDRMEDYGKNIDKNGSFQDDGKSLFDYISKEELLACTSCNACTDACPVNIDPLNIIVEMRRYLVMEKSDVPGEWAGMLSKIENNGAPWQFSPADRLNWADNVN